MSTAQKFPLLAVLSNRKIVNQLNHEDVLTRQQFSLFRIFSISGALVSLAVFAKMCLMFMELSTLHFILPVLSLIMLINFYTVSKVEQLRRAYWIVLLSGFMLLHIVSYSTGGIRSASVLYQPIIILYAFMLLEKRGGQLFSLLFLVHITAIFFISRYTSLTSFDFLNNLPDHIDEDFLFNAFFMAFLITAHSNYLNSGRNIVIQKITEQRDELERKNKQLNRTNEVLEKSNQELDKFAYVVSHDLKAPLRAIGSMAGILKEEMSIAISAEGKEYIGVIQQRVARMESLINGILKYSKVVKDKDDGTFVNMQEVIKNTVDSLEADKFCKIRLKNGEMPVKINKTQIEQVLLNLIGNAIKHCDKPVPEIEVSCEIQENVLHLNVRDNGPGIDEKYHDKVFVIFQTLRARDEFESTGIGLSIVKRLVDDVGGKIGIISQSGNGTTFWLHWPVEHPEEKQTNYKIAALF